jgi:hypothetical protein
MVQPLRFLEKTLEGERSQDELAPRSDPCYVWGLRGLDSRRDPVHGRIRMTDRSLQPHRDALRAARSELGLQSLFIQKSL